MMIIWTDHILKCMHINTSIMIFEKKWKPFMGDIFIINTQKRVCYKYYSIQENTTNLTQLHTRGIDAFQEDINQSCTAWKTSCDDDTRTNMDEWRASKQNNHAYGMEKQTYSSKATVYKCGDVEEVGDSDQCEYRNSSQTKSAKTSRACVDK